MSRRVAVQVGDARALLGVGPAAARAEIRAAYRRKLLSTHPDVSAAGDATERTLQLTAAYHALIEASSTPVADRRDAPAGEDAAERPRAAASAEGAAGATSSPPHHVVAVALVDAETLGVAAPAEETLMFLIDAAHRLGDITYLDRSAGLLELVVEFIDAPTSSVVLSLQGRSSGVTEVFCTVEPLSGGAAPPAPAVTRLILDTLVGPTDADTW